MWVEIFIHSISTKCFATPRKRCVSWNWTTTAAKRLESVTPRKGCVSWNEVKDVARRHSHRSHHARGVWVEIWNAMLRLSSSHLAKGVWVEIRHKSHRNRCTVTPRKGCVSWNAAAIAGLFHLATTPRKRCVSWNRRYGSCQNRYCHVSQGVCELKFAWNYTK